MTERAATVILVAGIVLTAASAAGLSTVAVTEGWMSRMALPELATTPATALGLAVGAVLIVAAFLVLAVAILGPPCRARKLRVAVPHHRYPARPSSFPPRGAGDTGGTLFAVGQAPVPAPGLAGRRLPSVPSRGGHGRARVGASAQRVEAPTLLQPRLSGALPPARQSAVAPVPAAGAVTGTGATYPGVGGSRGVAACPQAWAAADRDEFPQIRTGRGAVNTAALDETTS